MSDRAGELRTQLIRNVDDAPLRREPLYDTRCARLALGTLEGQGTLRVAGESLAAKAGDLVFIPAGPDYPYQFINTSNAPMKYLSLSTRQLPDVCEYPDSGKVRVMAEGFGLMQRRTDALDYWDGEP